MPINKKYPLYDLFAACKYYFKKTGRRISFEYALIEGLNDCRDDAEKLIKLLKGFPSHINLIPINNIKETRYKKSPAVNNFLKILTDNNMNATVRRSLGSDIEAACGQLRRDNL